MHEFSPPSASVINTDVSKNVTPNTSNLEIEFPPGAAERRGTSIERKSGAGGTGRRSIRVSIHGKRVQISLQTRDVAIAARRESTVREMLGQGETVAKVRGWVQRDDEDELLTLVRKKIASTRKRRQPTLGQLLPIIDSFEMLRGRKQVTLRQKSEIKSALRYLARGALIIKLEIRVSFEYFFPEEILESVPLEWICHESVNERVHANNLVARGLLQIAPRRTLSTHLSAVKVLFRPEFERHAKENRVKFPKDFLALVLAKSKRVAPAGPRLLRLADIASICKLILDLITNKVPGAWLPLAILYCPISPNRWIGNLDEWLCEPQRVRLKNGTLVLPEKVYMVLRGNYPFSPGSEKVTPTILRRVRWTPKVGQGGSLNPNQERTIHVQETTSAQCPVQSASWP